MPENNFHSLTDRLGQVRAAESGDQIGSGRLQVTGEKIVLEYVPDDVHLRALLARMPSKVPERLIFVDHNGVIGLDGCALRRERLTEPLPSLVEVHADHAIQITEISHDFMEVTCVRSEIAGLASWKPVITPTVKTTRFNGDTLLTDVNFESKAGATKEIGTKDGLRIVPYFSANSSWTAYGARHEIIERVSVETRVDGRTAPLTGHLKTHRKVQELLALAYGSSCGQRLVSVSSDTMPRKYAGMVASGDHWRGAISTGCWRGSTPYLMEPPNGHPLFYLDDIDETGICRWVEESSDWGCIVGPLMTWTFDNGGSVEVEVLQIAVALESLGHRIAVKQGLIKPNKRIKDYHFLDYLKKIGETLNCDVAPVIEGSPSYDTWSASFNDIYNQCKHADNPSPKGEHALIAARSGALLLRMWLAREFGVAPSTINRNARRSKR